MDCPQCAALQRQFGKKTARKDLQRYQKKGPNKTTQYILDFFGSLEVSELSLLEIGGGVGVIQHELIKKGIVSDVLNVDASLSYQHVVKDIAARLGYQEKIKFFAGDFVSLSDQVPDADIVALERVVCCYPNMVQLIEDSLARATSYYAVVYPLKTWWMEIGFRVLNFFMRITRNSFRVFLHKPRDLHALIRAYDFHEAFKKRAGIWWVEIYKKESSRVGDHGNA